MKLNTFKLRAECIPDVTGLMPKVSMREFKLESKFLPDCVFTFKTPLTLEQVKAAIKARPDNHVMLETVQPLKLYTGERTR